MNKTEQLLEENNQILRAVLEALRIGMREDLCQYNQWFYDHCLRNNLGPHDWIPAQHETPDYVVYICSHCGQSINAPKVLYSEHTLAKILYDQSAEIRKQFGLNKAWL